MSPRVSVLMPVYNGEKYLTEAIDSILSQSFTDFEFIIIDDGSRDNSLSITRDYSSSDDRIVLIENQQNLGVSASLNIGFRAVRGAYIARMDSDDISAPRRFEVQISFLDAHTDISVCGTWVRYFGDLNGVVKHPAAHDEIYARMLFENALAHPSVMLRADSVKKQSLYYDEEVLYAQDYELWSRAVTRVKMANIDQILLNHRVHSHRIGSRKGHEQQAVHGLVQRRLMEKIGLDIAHQDTRLHHQLSTHHYGNDVKFLSKTRYWLQNISSTNKLSRAIPQEILDAELTNVWARVCQQTSLNPIRLLAYVLMNPLSFRRDAGIQNVVSRIWSLVSSKIGNVHRKI